jgi:hypothetical protein
MLAPIKNNTNFHFIITGVSSWAFFPYQYPDSRLDESSVFKAHLIYWHSGDFECYLVVSWKKQTEFRSPHSFAFKVVSVQSEMSSKVWESIAPGGVK